MPMVVKQFKNTAGQLETSSYVPGEGARKFSCPNMLNRNIAGMQAHVRDRRHALPVPLMMEIWGKQVICRRMNVNNEQTLQKNIEQRANHFLSGSNNPIFSQLRQSG
jgi:hypothetical protein